MGFLIPLLLALLVQGLAEEGLASSTERPWLLVPALLLPHLIGWRARRASLAGRFALASRLFAVLSALPILLHAGTVLAAGWNASVAGLLGQSPRLLGWPNWSAPLALLPLVLFSALTIDARARALDSRPGEVARQRRFQLRQLLAALVPLLLFLWFAGLAGGNAWLRARVEFVQLDASLFALALLLAFLLGMPLVLRHAWDTQPLARGALRDLFEAAARRAGFRCREILVWNTGHTMANAAVVGLGPRLRMVFLSDALLAQLAARELLAVFAHEIGHARRHHVLVFVSWTAGFFLCADLALARWLPSGELWATSALVAAVALWYAGFGWLSRRFELDADLFSVELTGDVEGMVCALDSVGGPHGGARRTWRHFSIDARVQFLRSFALDAGIGLALRRRLRALTWVGVLLALLGVGLQARGVIEAYPVENARALLALGDHAAAGEALRSVVEAPASLLRQALLARELDLGAADDSERLAAAARASLEGGELARCLDLLGLGALRDPERFEGPLIELFSRPPASPDTDWESATQALARGNGAWAQALRATVDGLAAR